MPISCGNCGGVHDTVAEVRTCHQVAPAAPGDAPAPSGDSFDWSEGPGFASRPPDRSGAAPSPPSPPGPAPAAPVHAGPAALGRSLVIRPGQDVPADWASCPRVVVDDEARRDPTEVITQLAERWSARQPYVVELAAALDRHAAETDEREPWRLDPSFTFPLERLTHLVWSNALDLRDDATPTSEAVTAAVAAGATVADKSVADESVADVRTPAGEPAWCDGGPLDLGLAVTAGGARLLHHTWLEHGRVTPLADPAPTADLAADQLAAVTHRGGPCRVISPAGSGKTRTLTERARHLVAGWGLPPTALTLVAYNTRAAGEMRERLGELPGLQIRTLNSLGAGHRRRDGPVPPLGRPPAPGARRAGGAGPPRAPGQVPPAGQHRPGGAVDRGPGPGPPRPARPRRGRGRLPG